MLSERRDFVLFQLASSMTHSFLALIPGVPDEEHRLPDGEPAPWWTYATFGLICVFALSTISARHREARRQQKRKDSSQTRQ
jgi:hypothetical protein